jgi:hypothetical protein
METITINEAQAAQSIPVVDLGWSQYIADMERIGSLDLAAVAKTAQAKGFDRADLLAELYATPAHMVFKAENEDEEYIVCAEPADAADPVFAAIDASARAYDVWYGTIDDQDKDEACQKAYQFASRIDEELFDEAMATPPTTVAGVKALISWFLEHEDGMVISGQGLLETLLACPALNVA